VTDDVLNPTAHFQLGEQSYTLRAFSLAKTMKCLEYASRLFGRAEVVKLLSMQTTGEVLSLLAECLPDLLAGARPVLGQTLALVLVPNKQLLEWEDDELDIDAELKVRGRRLINDEEMTLENALNLLFLGVQQMQLEALRKNLPRLAALFRPGANPATNPTPAPEMVEESGTP